MNETRPPRPRLRLGVLASGAGSNLQAILDASREGTLDAEVVLVLSDKEDARALVRAREAGVKALAVPRRGATREEHDRALAGELDAAGVELVCLAGYMRLLSSAFVRRYEGRLLNIHPSLLPSFRGLDGVRQALEAGVRVTGCTVHFVTEELDAGPILLQAAVAVHEDDTPETLHQRIHKAEHALYPAAIQLVAEGRVRLEGGRVRVDGGNGLDGAVLPRRPAPGGGA